MHEISLTRDILRVALDYAKGQKIRSIRLHVGALANVEIHALRFCFDACALGTNAEGASLLIDTIPARALCTLCQQTLSLPEYAALCPCEKKARLRILSGDELLIKEMETESCA